MLSTSSTDKPKCEMTVWGVANKDNSLLGVGVGKCGEPAIYLWEGHTYLCEKHALEGNKLVVKL